MEIPNTSTPLDVTASTATPLDDPSSDQTMMTIVLYLYSSSPSSSSLHKDQSPSRELIAQLTTFITFYEQRLPLSSFKLLFYEAFSSFLKNPGSVDPSTTAKSLSNRTNSSPISSQQLSYDIPRSNLQSWQNLVNSDPYLGENQSPMTLIILDVQQLRTYFQTVKNYESLMIVLGDNPQDLDLYSNWIHDEDHPNRTLADTLQSLSHSNKLNSDEYDTADISLPLIESFILAHGYEMPAPNIRVLLQQTRTATDMYGKSYTVYNMVVIQGKLEWTIEHRYSDFAKLHETLLEQDETEMGYIPRHLLPHLTKKKLQSRSLLESTIEKRRIKLCRYINTLVTIEQALSNHHVLSFLGTINTARLDSVNISKGISRNTIHISKLRSEAKWGDIILFKCANTLSHLQRRVTRSEWDHVGIVVRSQQKDGNIGLELLEATGEGVTSYPLTGRLKAYYFNNFTKYMAIRQLKNFERTPERLNLLDEFVAQVVGKPYGFTASQIFPSKKATNDSCFSRLFSNSMWNSLTGGEKAENQEEAIDEVSETYFCSELVAAALKHMGLLPSYLNSGYFWPGCFAKGDELDNLMISSLGNYGDEFILDCRVMEISRAIEKRPSHLIQSSYEPDSALEEKLLPKEKEINAPKSTFVPSLF